MSKHIYSKNSALVYIAVNLSSSTLKSYVGVTTRSLSIRKSIHLSDSKRKSNIPFHKSIKKYGSKNFQWFILDITNDVKYAFNILEPYYIKLCRSFIKENGYNLTLGGEGIPGKKCSPETISKMCKIAQKRGNNHIPKVLDEQTLRKLYLDQSKSMIEIGKILKCSRVMVSKWLINYHISIRYGGVTKHKPSKEFLLDKYLIEHLSMVEIGSLLNVTHDLVSKWLKDYQIPINPGCPRKIPSPSKEILEFWYNKNRLGTKTIAKKFNVNESVAKRWLKESEIPLRLKLT